MKNRYALALASGTEKSALEDIFTLIDSAITQFESLDQLPFQEIIKQVAAYRGRPRRSSS